MAKITKSDVFFHSADPLSSPWPYFVTAGGRSSVSHKDGVVSRHYHEHTLILTISGQGRIMVENGVFPSHPGSAVWLDTSRNYAHGAARRHEWAYIWLAMSGYGLDQLHEQAGLMAQPVIEGMDSLLPRFEAIVQNLADQLPTAEAAMNVGVAEILFSLYQKRSLMLVEGGAHPVAHVMRRLRRDIAQNWDIPLMAEVAGLSHSQLFRQFRRFADATPMAWLRQERMRLARHLLTASTERVSEIARRCGYADPFHFSRDFKHQNGVSPRIFRLEVTHVDRP